MLLLMDNPDVARRSELATYEAALNDTDNGYATLLPMILAWRVAGYAGLIASDDLKSLCIKQLELLQRETERLGSAHILRELVPLYEAGAAGKGRLASAGTLIAYMTA